MTSNLEGFRIFKYSNFDKFFKCHVLAYLSIFISISNLFCSELQYYSTAFKAKNKSIITPQIKIYSILYSEIKTLIFSILFKTCFQNLPLFC